MCKAVNSPSLLQLLFHTKLSTRFLTSDTLNPDHENNCYLTTNSLSCAGTNIVSLTSLITVNSLNRFYLTFFDIITVVLLDLLGYCAQHCVWFFLLLSDCFVHSATVFLRSISVPLHNSLKLQHKEQLQNFYLAIRASRQNGYSHCWNLWAMTTHTFLHEEQIDFRNMSDKRLLPRKKGLFWSQPAMYQVTRTNSHIYSLNSNTSIPPLVLDGCHCNKLFLPVKARITLPYLNNKRVKTFNSNFYWGQDQRNAWKRYKGT